MDFINDLTHGSGHKAEHKAYDSTPSQPTHTQPEHQSLFDKFGDAVDTLSGKTHTPPPPPPPKKSENIFDRINDALNFGEAPPPPPPPPKSEGIFDKISDVLHAGRSEEPPKPQTFGDKVEDKLNSALGGGSRGEAKEGHLDKGSCCFTSRSCIKGKC